MAAAYTFGMIRLVRLLLPPLIFLGLVLPAAVAFLSVPAPAQERSAIPVLPADASWYEHARVVLREEAVLRSAPEALRMLRLLMRTDRRVAPFCHGLAHEIGHAALRAYGFSEAVAVHDDLCGSGYIHGIVEQALEEESDLIAAAVRYCGEGNPVCYHGVGHGFMAALGNDAVVALARCAELPEATARIKCSEGVFMEHFSPEGSPHAVDLDLETAFGLCAEAGSPYDSACAYYAPRAYLAAHQNDAAGAVSWCRKKGGNLRFYCMRGVGAMLMKRRIGEPLTVERLCKTVGDKEEAQTCIAGMTSYWVVHHASVQKGAELCGQLEVGHQSICRKTVDDGRGAYPEE